VVRARDLAKSRGRRDGLETAGLTSFGMGMSELRMSSHRTARKMGAHMLTGGCLCGASSIRNRHAVSPDELPLRDLPAVRRRAVRGVFSVRRSDFRFLQGAPTEFRSSATGRRGFCRAAAVNSRFTMKARTRSTSRPARSTTRSDCRPKITRGRAAAELDHARGRSAGVSRGS
jgi:hypothetical protein